MPTYVYACDACGKQFEQFQSFRDEPLTVCRCGESGRVRRVIQPAGIVFKGSGWYINDSRGASSSTVGSTANAGDGSTGESAAPAAAPAADAAAPAPAAAPAADAD